MYKIFLVGMGGFLGSVSRYSFSLIFTKFTFPFSTLIVNVMGCFGIGVLHEYFKKNHWSEVYTLLILVGFLGAFTTFSALSLETYELFKNGHLLKVFFNIFSNLLLCLIAVKFGTWLMS